MVEGTGEGAGPAVLVNTSPRTTDNTQATIKSATKHHCHHFIFPKSYKQEDYGLDMGLPPGFRVALLSNALGHLGTQLIKRYVKHVELLIVLEKCDWVLEIRVPQSINVKHSRTSAATGNDRPVIFQLHGII